MSERCVRFAFGADMDGDDERAEAQRERDRCKAEELIDAIVRGDGVEEIIRRASSPAVLVRRMCGSSTIGSPADAALRIGRLDLAARILNAVPDGSLEGAQRAEAVWLLRCVWNAPSRGCDENWVLFESLASRGVACEYLLATLIREGRVEERRYVESLASSPASTGIAREYSVAAKEIVAAPYKEFAASIGKGFLA